ncbi:MAG: hypothetical protein ABIG93_05865 [archaeon]
MSSLKEIMMERVGIYSAALVSGPQLQPNILDAIEATGPDGLGIGAISIVGPGPEHVTKGGVDAIEAALTSADTRVDSYSTGSPGTWIFDPKDPQYDIARQLAHNNNGLFTYTGEGSTPLCTAAYKIAAIVTAIDLADMVGHGRFVTFHVGDMFHGREEEISHNMLVVGEYAMAKGVSLGIERGEIPGLDMVRYVTSVNEELGAQVVYVNTDMANPYIWGANEDTLGGSRILKEAGVVGGEHAKGAILLTDAKPTAWQADEHPIYAGDSVVDLVAEVGMSRELVGPDGHTPLRMILESELKKDGTQSANYKHVQRSLTHLANCMQEAGY